MSCKSCESLNQRNLNGEIAIHFTGLKGLDKPIVWVFPKLLVCLDCGITEFAISREGIGRARAQSFRGRCYSLSPENDTRKCKSLTVKNALGSYQLATDKVRTAKSNFYRKHQVYARVRLPNVSLRSVA